LKEHVDRMSSGRFEEKKMGGRGKSSCTNQKKMTFVEKL
jgi:hypothetical protein